MYGGTAKASIRAHLKKLTPGKSCETIYADPTPKIKVKNITPIRSIKELNIYSKKKCFFKISK